MSLKPEEKKAIAFEEAKKFLPDAKEEVLVVYPFMSAWVDPTEEAKEAIQNWASSKNISGGFSMFSFKVEKAKEPKKIKE